MSHRMVLAVYFEDKYSPAFEQIKDIPDYNRVRAKTRYRLIKECDQYLKDESNRLGKRYRKKAAIIRFCNIHGLSVTTFYRWLRLHKKYGIKGLVPKFGKGGWKKTVKNKTYRPSRPDERTINANIDIDVLHPLTCLNQVNAIVQRDPSFSPFVKNTFGQLANSLRIAKDGGNAILLPRKLTSEERDKLNAYLRDTHINHRARALGLLMMDSDCSLQEIILKTQKSRTTIYRWLRLFKENGLDFLETKPFSEERQQKLEQRKVRTLDILHSPPSTYGIQRSGWTLGSISQAYRSRYGEHVPIAAVSRALKEEGYSWRRAQKVLTSNDPKYREKTERIIKTLNELEDGDAFFFIDEAGPWHVKKYGGRSWMPIGETRIVPEHQESKGKLYWIAALEIQSNQVLWQYINGKTSKALVAMLELIFERYRAHSRIFVTWDALSSHKSKLVNNWIGANNFRAKWDSRPTFHVRPLPTRSQFLNVVETTFANTRRAVIHNSDYQSVEEMKAAIDGYLKGRNDNFRINPKKAGKKIWDKEIFSKKEWIKGAYRRM